MVSNQGDLSQSLETTRLSPRKGLSAADLRRLAMVHNSELKKALDGLPGLDGTKQLMRSCETSQAFLKALALVPDNGCVIAITGLQGVGKSTLANALLGIPASDPAALPTGLLRCETIPMLVRAPLPGERSSGHYLPEKFSGDPQDSLISISLPVAKRIAQGEVPENRDKAILVDYPLPPHLCEILPPFVYLLILPGFEKGQPWSELAMASMLLADQAVFVVDHSALASQTGKALLQDAMARFGRDALTVVFSKMDMANQDPAQLGESLNELGVGAFSSEQGNLFLAGVGAEHGRRDGIEALRETLFGVATRPAIHAKASRARQLAYRLKQFAEDDLDTFIHSLRSIVEASQAGQMPNAKIYYSLLNGVTKAKVKAVEEAHTALVAAVSREFKALPQAVEKRIQEEANAFRAFFDQFRPWQAYDDQQDVKLDKIMRDMVDERLQGIPHKILHEALEAFMAQLPASSFQQGDVGDAQWRACLGGDLRSGTAQQNVSGEFLSALKPVVEVMLQILDKTAKAGQSIDKETIKNISIDVIGTTGIKNLRRGLLALGLVEAGELGFETAKATAGTAAVAGSGTAASAGAAISAPVAAAVAAVAVGVVAALCLKAAKGYKKETGRQAKYLVTASQDGIIRSMDESVERILNWFQDRLDEGLQVELGLRRVEATQYHLAVQCERLTVLRGATLKALSDS